MISLDAVVEEVRRLHAFFDDWFSGRSGLAIEELSEALDEDFTIVSPHGTISTRNETVTAVEDKFGAIDVVITVENLHARRIGDTYLCRYDEIHDVAGERSRRVSTAVLVPDESSPGGLRWISVHETSANS